MGQILIVLLDYVIPGKGGAAAPTNRGVATEQVCFVISLNPKPTNRSVATEQVCFVSLGCGLRAEG